MRFPEEFRFGVATSAYQVEGAVDEDGRGPSTWDTFSHTPGKIANGDTGDVACDHYHRMPEDVELMRELDITDYRFSIAWSRVIPDGRGPVNQKGLDFYRSMVDRLLAAKIRPAVTLFHWDLPQALEDAGGWLRRGIVDDYVRYATVMWDALGDRVHTWITHNEPWVLGVLGYQLGLHAPGHTSLAEAVQVMHHVLLSHGASVQAYRGSGLSGEIGITLNLFATQPASASAADVSAAEVSEEYTNRWFLDALYRGVYPERLRGLYEAEIGALDFVHDADLAVIATPTDFLGLNYYARRLVTADPLRPLGIRVQQESLAYLPLTDDGWGIYPQGLEDVLMLLHDSYGNPPVLITENGAVYHDVVAEDGQVHDAGRVDFFRAHLQEAQRAMQRGAALRGYYAWSLLDNFEWAEGYAKRFGIVYVDHASQRRILKDSARFFSRLIRERAL